MKIFNRLSKISCGVTLLLLLIILPLISLAQVDQKIKVKQENIIKEKLSQNSKSLKPRNIIPKPSNIKLNADNNTGIIILKFSEGTHLRLYKEEISLTKNPRSDYELKLLERNKISSKLLNQELEQFSSLIKTNSIKIQRLFQRPESDYDKELLPLQIKANEELADLNLYFLLYPKNTSTKSMTKLLNELNKLNIVETVYPMYVAADACQEQNPSEELNSPPSATPDFSNSQGYLKPAPEGIDAKYAWILAGGDGHGVRIIDVEQSWNRDHEDFPHISWISGSTEDDCPGHGTAVVGIMGAVHNGFGVDGICAGSWFGLSSIVTIGGPPSSGGGNQSLLVSWAINNAVDTLREGDIILIEQETSTMLANPVSSSERGYIAMEYYQDCFDAIQNATAKGIIVVEAAGNGSVNLDNVHEFDRSFRDSKAIIVAAGNPRGGPEESFTNFGARIDANGWGRNITTLGGSCEMSPYVDPDKKFDGDPNRYYTTGFARTSGATPIVAGAIACIQGILKKNQFVPLNSEEMRTLIKNTGTPQSSNPGMNIGKRPDIKNALAFFHLDVVPSKPVICTSSEIDYPSLYSIMIRDVRGLSSIYTSDRKTWVTFDGTIPEEYSSNSLPLDENYFQFFDNCDRMPVPRMHIPSSGEGQITVTAKTFCSANTARLGGDTAIKTFTLYHPLDGPTRFRASTGWNDRVTLNWDPVPDAINYDIYYEYSDNNPFNLNCCSDDDYPLTLPGYSTHPVKVNDIPIMSTTYDDITYRGTATTHHYFIRANMPNNRITLAAGPVVGILAIPSTGISAVQVAQQTSVHLSWALPAWADQNPLVDLDIEYSIYRSSDQAFNPNSILSTLKKTNDTVIVRIPHSSRNHSGSRVHGSKYGAHNRYYFINSHSAQTFYDDNSVVRGQTYYYRVIASKKINNNSVRSSPPGIPVRVSVN